MKELAWVKIPEMFPGRIRRRGAMLHIPHWDMFNVLLQRATGIEDAESVAKELEDEIVARRPDLIGAQVVAFGWSPERHSMWMSVLHGSLPAINDGELATEIVLEPRNDVVNNANSKS